MGLKDTFFTTLYIASHPRSWKNISRWRTSLKEGHSSISDALPWVTFGAIDWMQSYLNKGSRVYEYGSGGSTLFLSRTGADVISVEHEEEWYKKLTQELAARNQKATVLLHKPEATTNTAHKYSSFRYKGFEFENYVRSIESQPDASLDLVIVDGRARNQCIEAALPKVKKGGYILLDNANRTRYKKGVSLLATYPRTDFYGLGPFANRPWLTSIWQIDK